MRTTVNQIIFSTGIIFSSLVFADFSQGVYDGVSKFSFQKASLPTDYVKMLPSFIHGLLQQSETAFSAAGNLCSEKTDVQFVDRLTATTNSVASNFESNFIRIEVSKCFENTTAEKVLSVLNSEVFKSKAYSTVTSVKAQANNVICETSKAPWLGKSHYCYENFLDKSDPRYLKLFSMNDWYEMTADYTVPVYYRESLVTARQQGSRVELYSISYARGPELSLFQQFFAKSFIATTQDAVFTTLAEEIKK